MTSPQAPGDAASEPSRPSRDASTALVAAIAAIAGVVLGGLLVFFIAQQQIAHADEMRLQEKREVAYMTFIDHGQNVLEGLPAINANDLKTATPAINASKQLDDDLTTIQIVGTPTAAKAAFAVWRSVSDALTQVLNGKISGSDAVNLQIIALTHGQFLEVARLDMGFADSADR